MWAFLLTEILFFGGLFMAYMLYRTWYHDAFVAASTSITISWGLLNTVVLIGSSLTMALAVRSAQLNQRKPTVNWLIATMVLGIGVPRRQGDRVRRQVRASSRARGRTSSGQRRTAQLAAVGRRRGAAEPQIAPRQRRRSLQMHTQIFFSLYFTMTGLHALHMIIGIGLMSRDHVDGVEGRFSSEYYTPVEMSGLYWHFVDIVWIYPVPAPVSHRSVLK